MNFPAADSPRLTAALAPVALDEGCEVADLSAALAYIATAEGTAAQMAERACDRAGIDFAACPVEIQEAADKREAVLILGDLVPGIIESRRLAARAVEVAAKPRYRGQADDVRRIRAGARVALCLGGIAARVQSARPDLDVGPDGREFRELVDRLIALV